MKKILTGIAVILMLACSTPTVAMAAEDTYISKEVQEACIKYGEEYNI